MSQTTAGSSEEDAPIKYVCGIDVGSQSCSGCVCRPDTSVLIKPVTSSQCEGGLLVPLLSNRESSVKRVHNANELEEARS